MSWSFIGPTIRGPWKNIARNRAARLRRGSDAATPGAAIRLANGRMPLPFAPPVSISAEYPNTLNSAPGATPIRCPVPQRITREIAAWQYFTFTQKLLVRSRCRSRRCASRPGRAWRVAARPAPKNMKPDDMKRAIGQWRADDYRALSPSWLTGAPRVAAKNSRYRRCRAFLYAGTVILAAVAPFANSSAPNSAPRQSMDPALRA